MGAKSLDEVRALRLVFMLVSTPLPSLLSPILGVPAVFTEIALTPNDETRLLPIALFLVPIEVLVAVLFLELNRELPLPAAGRALRAPIELFALESAEEV